MQSHPLQSHVKVHVKPQEKSRKATNIGIDPDRR